MFKHRLWSKGDNLLMEYVNFWNSYGKFCTLLDLNLLMEIIWMQMIFILLNTHLVKEQVVC